LRRLRQPALRAGRPIADFEDKRESSDDFAAAERACAGQGEAPWPAAGAPFSSCFMPSEMRSFSTSTSRTMAETCSPLRRSASASSPETPQATSDMWTMP
jgi:hypothetical protein